MMHCSWLHARPRQPTAPNLLRSETRHLGEVGAMGPLLPTLSASLLAPEDAAR
jgi:hypothetical protein